MTLIIKEMARPFGSETKEKEPLILIIKWDQNETLRFVFFTQEIMDHSTHDISPPSILQSN